MRPLATDSEPPKKTAQMLIAQHDDVMLMLVCGPFGELGVGTVSPVGNQ
jgi:hypothetical protein